MSAMCNAGSAILFGAADAFGSEIAARLADDYTVACCEGTGAESLQAVFSGSDKVDVLVINVPAETGETGFLDISDAAFDRAMQHFVCRPVAIAQAALPAMATGARIVFVSSKGYLGAWGGAHLMAASAALAAMARSMSLELAGRQIAVNLVAPDFVGSKWDQPQSRRAVASAVAYLANPDSGMSGETLLIDSGRSLRMAESRRH